MIIIADGQDVGIMDARPQHGCCQVCVPQLVISSSEYTGLSTTVVIQLLIEKGERASCPSSNKPLFSVYLVMGMNPALSVSMA